MVATKFMNLLTLLSFAVLACTFVAQPVDALVTGGHNGARSHVQHNVLAKKARRTAASTRRCRPRPSSSLAHSVSQATSVAAASSAASSAAHSSESSKVIVTSTVTASSTYVAPTTTSTHVDPTTTHSTESAEPTTSKAAPPPPPTSKAAPPPESSKAAPPPPPATSKAAPPPPATTAAPKPSPTSSPSGGSGKVGLAWANGNDDPTISNFVTKQVKYVYTWSPDCPTATQQLGLTCIPMLWGPNQIDDFKAKVVPGYSNMVASFNEPNQDGQSNLDPTYAAGVHKQYVDPLKNHGYQILSPATSSAPNGMTWMKTFFAACGDCQFDIVAVHWYDVSFDAFKTYLELWHNTFNKNIMVTEFADQNFNGGAQATSDEVWAFYKQAVEYMEGQDWVVAYFGFGVMLDMQGVNSANQLMASNKQPTPLGYNYINAKWN